jgi:hypothetical protein
MTLLKVITESWPIRGTFTISRGSKTTADVVVVELSHGGLTGRGEAVPYTRYGETLQSVVDQIESLHGALAEGLDRLGLQALLPAGAARNAVHPVYLKKPLCWPRWRWGTRMHGPISWSNVLAVLKAQPYNLKILKKHLNLSTCDHKNEISYRVRL